MLQADNFVWLPEYGQSTFLPYLFTDSRVQEPVHIWLELGLRHSCFVDICVIFFLNRSTLRPVEMAYWVKYSGSELMNGLFWVKYSALWGGLTDIRRGEPECARHHQNWNFPLRCQCILFPNEIAILSLDQNRKVWKLFYSILETAALSSLYFTYILSFPYSTVLIGNLCFPVALFPKREAGFP